jgi:hypothetical protein
MLRTCWRIIALTAMVSGLSMTAQSADTTLTLACKATETQTGGAGTVSEKIEIGIIVDFQKKRVIGLSDDPLTIRGVDETTVSFDAMLPGWVMNGTIDRVTGMLVAASTKSHPATGKEILSLSYDLRCRPTQRMF